MMHRYALIRRLALGVLGLVMGGVGALAQAQDQPPLVDAAWLNRALAGQSPPVVLDASPRKLHDMGHIPGAVSADFYSYGSREVDAKAMQARMRSWGLNEGHQLIVIHDQGGAMLATWQFYELYRHGVPLQRLRLLDGGLAAWKASGGKLTGEATPAPQPGNLVVRAPQQDPRAYLPEFLQASGDPSGHALLEALDPPFYYGGAKFFSRGGHVPHALLTPADDFFRPDKTFKSPAELEGLLAHLGVRREQQLISYCGGGVAASVPFFAAKFLLGYPQVKLYQGSQREWLQDPRDLPLWAYAAPAMLRSAEWLNGFSNTMLRTYSHSPISVVDVRPTQAYAQGHVPFALSLPAEQWRNHLAQPQGLRPVLGAAGVNPEDEAVVVSEGGINPQAALAVALLEHLGQRKVSVLMDSLDDWGLKGLPVVKEPTRLGVKQSVLDPTIEPVAYSAQPRPVLLANALAAQAEPRAAGLPLVFLWVGAQAPAPLALPGTSVHLPYGQLLQANGQPKPAHELWSALSKAGLPRHARIISVGGEPSEAAVAYVVLRLMGFSDLRLALQP